MSWKLQPGFTMQYIPYSAMAQAVRDLISGDLHMTATLITGNLVELHEAGKIKILGITDSKRSVLAPAVPAIAETVPGFEVLNWQGITAPAKTPAAIVQVLHGHLVATLKRPGMNEALAHQGLDSAGAGPDEFGALIKSEIAKYGKVVKVAGIRGE